MKSGLADAHVRGHGTAEVTCQQHRTQHRRPGNQIHQHARQQGHPEAEHDIRRVPELPGSVDDGLHFEQLADAVEDEERHGQPADDPAGPQRPPRAGATGRGGVREGDCLAPLSASVSSTCMSNGRAGNRQMRTGCRAAERQLSRRPLQASTRRSLELMLRCGWRRTGPPPPPRRRLPPGECFWRRPPGSPPRGLCAVGWPRVGLSGDRTRVSRQLKRAAPGRVDSGSSGGRER